MLKKLNEDRNAKVTEMQALVNKATEENRALNVEEIETFNKLEAEVAEIDKSIDAFNRANTITLSPIKEANVSVKDKEEKAFANMVRGIVNSDDPTTVSDGQVTIPTTIASRIIDAVVEICPIFEMSDRYYLKGKVVLPKYDKANSSIAMTYATEGTTADSGNVHLTSIELEGFLGRALAKVSKSLINNSQFDIVSFVIAKMSQAIAEFLEKELLYGTADKIDGLSTIGSDMTVTTSSATAVTVDELMDCQDKVVDKYQSNSVWIMNKSTRNAIRKLKDNEGQYLLNRDLTAKWGYTLLGKDVYCSDAMDEIGAGKIPVYYGDLTGLAVKISEDINMQVLNEKYAEEHMTGVLAFVECDAKIADTQKISRIKVASASL